MIDAKKDTSKTSDDFEDLEKPVRIVDESLDSYENREVQVDLHFFKGLLVGVLVSVFFYLTVLYLLLK